MEKKMTYTKSIQRTLENLTTTTRYTPTKLKGDKNPMGDDDQEDFPYVEDPTPFVTHKAMEQIIRASLTEQPATGTKPVAPATDPAIDAAAPTMPATKPGDTPVSSDPALAGLGTAGDLGMGGLGTAQPDYVKLDSSEIGRVYEMKKIYSRLTSVEAYLSESTDQNLLELRRGVGKAIDLFEVVITNISKFKEKIDPIIVTFYEFLDQVYSALRKYHIGQSKES